jgi:methylated-DNA-[protein]-cysteine S-methyltransferase
MDVTTVEIDLQPAIGPIEAVSATFDTDGRLAALTLLRRPATAPSPVCLPAPARDSAARLALQLAEYAAGRRRDFDVALAPDGTDFQQRVWSALRAIPGGETRTYGELASAVGRPGGARAVGGANGSNPIALVVPCHRVVATDGLGGYTGGLDLKVALLAHEGVPPRLPARAPVSNAQGALPL